MADLISLEQLKDAIGYPIDDTDKDGQFQQAITFATAAIRDYTQRNIGAPAEAATKTYSYDGRGWLTIDDATAVTSVTMDGVALVANTDYVLGPDRPVTPTAPLVYEWLELVPYSGGSPEMGFERNLDQLWWKTKRRFTIQVTGTFGWGSQVPDGVEQAAVLTAVHFVERVKGYSSFQIESYGASTSPELMREAVPKMAKDLLSPFKRYTGLG